MLDKMLKNKTRLALKMFIILWFLLFLQVILKLTFNYWQPYVIPTPQLEAISNFIDNNRWIRDILDGILYVFNGLIVILTGLQIWWFKNKKQGIIVILIIVLSYLFSVFVKQSTILTLILNFGIPLIINYKKFIWVVITFAFNNLFLWLSLWLEGFTNVNDMMYIIKVFFQGDYYIMLLLSYILFNFFRIELERRKNNGTKSMV